MKGEFRSCRASYLGRLRHTPSFRDGLAFSYPCVLQAWLGYYNGALRRLSWGKEDLVAAANDWISLVGQPVPMMDPQTLAKMGLRGVKGIHEGPGGKGGRGGEARGGGRG